MDGTEAPEILGESEAIQKVRRAVGRLAGSALPVLIVGEEGTGKQLVARALHHASPRNEGAFVALACQDVPRDRAVAELFGGPGAGEEQAVGTAGLMDVATHGTLYLEEISALDLAAQDRLLPVLASSTEDDPRGGTRVIAATSSELEPLVTQSLFLPELFRRLSEATIVVPPLRDRGQDVLLFAHRCLRLRAAELGRSAPTFSPHALEVLGSYPWPGNLPELNNCLRGVVTSLKGDTIEVPDFPGPVRTWLQGGAKHLRPIAAVEAEHIRNVLAVVGGNKSRAAEILGISRKTLREKLKQDIRS